MTNSVHVTNNGTTNVQYCHFMLKMNPQRSFVPEKILLDISHETPMIIIMKPHESTHENFP